MKDLFYKLGVVFKYLHLDGVYVIDSFPVSVCKNVRISGSKLIRGEGFRGYNASKKEYFYGFKIHVITTGEGLPVEFLVTPASVHDNKALQRMDMDLPTNCD